MKKILIASVAVLITALALTNDANAQSSENLAYSAPVKSYFNVGITDAPQNLNTISLEMVNTKALKNFRKKYKVTNEKWAQGFDCITANYELDNTSQIIYFDNKGNWTASLKTYKEEIMPGNIRKMIVNKYNGYNIMLVNEIETIENKGNPVYLISIEEGKNVKELLIQDNYMDVYKEFTKS